jgi:hypothetical protein
MNEVFRPLYQLPFFVTRMGPRDGFSPQMYEMALFATFTSCFISPITFGLSLFIMKEEDMSIRPGGAHAGNTTVKAYNPPGMLPHLL